MRIRTLTALVFSTLILSSCSEEQSRPTTDELETMLWALAKSENNETEQSVIHCQARELEKSSISDEGLRAFVGDDEYDMSAAEKKTLSTGGEVWVKLQTCQQNV